jgi:two-component system sensor histidine kinase AlgZ
MHPFLASRSRVLLYLTAWFFVGVMLAFLLQAATPRTPGRVVVLALPMAIVYAFMCLSSGWVCRTTPLGATSVWRGVAIIAAATLVEAVVWAGIANLWAQLSAPVSQGVSTWFDFGGHGSWAFAAGLSEQEIRLRDVTVFFAAGIGLYLFSCAVSYLLIAFEKASEAEKQALESQVLARDAEVRALRAQLNPHFLFNSLNSINALVGNDPEAARRMCERLGDFLRQTLSLAGRETVPLGDEVKLVERYLAIEQVRFGERLSQDIRVNREVAKFPLPPLLLQPLVENAVKHGISERVEGGTIQVTADPHGDGVRIVVENPFDEDAITQRGEGVGLENVRRRLRATEARRAQLTTSKTGGQYRVELTISGDGMLPASEEGAAP